MELEKSKFVVIPSKLDEELKSNFDLLKLELIKKFDRCYKVDDGLITEYRG